MLIYDPHKRSLGVEDCSILLGLIVLLISNFASFFFFFTLVAQPFFFCNPSPQPFHFIIIRFQLLKGLLKLTDCAMSVLGTREKILKRMGINGAIRIKLIVLRQRQGPKWTNKKRLETNDAIRIKILI